MDGSTHITDVLKACSDFTRLRMMRLLVTSGAEFCVGELVQSLQGRPYNISKQLKVLEHAGMVARKKRGRHVYYQRAAAEGSIAELVFSLIGQLPDSDGVFDSDRVRLEELINQRELSDGQAPASMSPSQEIGDASAVADNRDALNTPILVEEETLPSNLL